VCVCVCARAHLNVYAQEVRRQKAQGQLSLALKAEQLHCVHQLLRGHIDVDHTKVLTEAMAHKHTATVHQVPVEVGRGCTQTCVS
jgi:hypothetical protein